MCFTWLAVKCFATKCRMLKQYNRLFFFHLIKHAEAYHAIVDTIEQVQQM